MGLERCMASQTVQAQERTHKERSYKNRRGISQAARTGVHTPTWQYGDGFSLISREPVGSFCIRQGSSTHRVVLHTVCCRRQSHCPRFTSFPSVTAEALQFALAATAARFPGSASEQLFLTQHVSPGGGRAALPCSRQDELNAFAHFS